MVFAFFPATNNRGKFAVMKIIPNELFLWRLDNTSQKKVKAQVNNKTYSISGSDSGVKTNPATIRYEG